MRGQISSLERYRKTLKAKKSADTLKAARAAYGRPGHNDANVSDIARAADVSTTPLDEHYRSKERLLAAVFGRGVAAQGGQPNLNSPVASMLLNMLIAEASRIKQVLEEEQRSAETLDMAEGVIATLQQMAKELQS